jgi:hypothetical protein
VKVYVVTVELPCAVEPRYAVYPVTPMLSVEAVQANVIEVAVAEPATSPDGADGATVSGHALVEAEIELRGDRFPAASNASTPNVYVVPQAKPLNTDDNEVVVATAVPFRNV